MTYPILSDAPTGAIDDAAGTADVDEAVQEIRATWDWYDAAREYDSINLLEAMDMSRLGRTLRQLDIEYDPNFCAVVIDSVADRMEILSATATTGDAENEQATEHATAVLADILDDNEWENYYREWNRCALRDGDGYVCVWPDAEYDLDSRVNITYIDGRAGRMFYDRENPRKKRFFAQMWEVVLPGEKNPRTRLNLYYDDRIEKYVSNQRGGKKAQDFVQFTDEDGEQWPVPNPWGQIPVFHLRTRLPYGLPEHANAFALQDAISTLMEILMVVVSFEAWPQRYALQEADSYGTQHIQEDPLADDSFATQDGPDFPGVNLNTIRDSDWGTETGSDHEASPGTMQLFKNFKEVGQFATADPNTLLDPMRDCIKAIAATTSTPMHKFQGFGGNAPSGESLKIANAPLNRKVQNRNRVFGAAYKQALEFALLLSGVDAHVTVTWQNPEFEDTFDTWALVEKKVKVGVPLQFALMQAGVPEDQALEWATLREKARASVPNEEVDDDDTADGDLGQ